MAFSWLQFAIPHGEGSLKLSDIHWASLDQVQTGLYSLLVAVMLVLTLVSLLLTVVFLKNLARWVVMERGHKEFLTNPPSRITGIFVPIASLAMTIAVVLAVAPFFIPAVSANPQMLAVPGSIFFAALWLTILGLEWHVLKGWLGQPLDADKLNFVWLLDVFAFGLVSLAGTGLASMVSNRGMASAIGFASMLTLGLGSLLLAAKLIFLVSALLRSRTLPERQLQPAFFLLVPITCLYGISYYRIMLLLEKWFELDVRGPSYLLITSAYVIGIGWGVFTVYLLASYFRSYFRSSEYFPTQWAMV